ncbi:MAG: response regulator [Acidimicrobiales bacterium]
MGSARQHTHDWSCVTISVFVVDDHAVVRRGLRELIEAEEDLTVVGEAATTEEALELIPEANPDVAVLDVRFTSGGNGIELCRELRTKNDKLVALMLTSIEDDEALAEAVMAGAAGYVLKQIREPEILDAIRTVAAGGSLFDPQVTDRVLRRVRSREASDDPMQRLTSQEHRVLKLIVEGRTNGQIASTLFLSEKTVKNYVSNLLSKLGMKRRTEAAVYAVKRNQRRDPPDW